MSLHTNIAHLLLRYTLEVAGYVHGHNVKVGYSLYIYIVGASLSKPGSLCTVLFVHVGLMYNVTLCMSYNRTTCTSICLNTLLAT